MASPRVTKLSQSRPRKRCRKNRPSRNPRTISPRSTSPIEQAAISATSPGHSVGSMLSPRTCRRNLPVRRNTSAARASRCVLPLSPVLMRLTIRNFFVLTDRAERWSRLFRKPARVFRKPARSGTRVSDRVSCLYPRSSDAFPLRARADSLTS